MRKIDEIRELKDIFDYLQSRNILDQYVKAKKMISSGYLQKFDFKLRQPKISQVYQFRINQKYRAFGTFREENDKTVFVVTQISDHQDF